MPKENIKGHEERRIGLLGGTFDPVHKGHLELAKKAENMASLNKIFFIPNYKNPFKKELSHSSIKDRLAMLELALAPYPSFSLSLYETNPQIHYTVQTLEYFKKMHPKARLFFIAGEDILEKLSFWKNFPSFFKFADFIIFSRSEESIVLPEKLIPYKQHILLFSAPPLLISSSHIRSWVYKNPNREISSVPQKVSDYIREKKLYQKDSHP